MFDVLNTQDIIFFIIMLSSSLIPLLSWSCLRHQYSCSHNTFPFFVLFFCFEPVFLCKVSKNLKSFTRLWNCTFTNSKDLTWNNLKFLKIVDFLIYFRIPFRFRLQFSDFFLRDIGYWQSPLNALFVFASVLYSCLTFETLQYPWIPSSSFSIFSFICSI